MRLLILPQRSQRYFTKFTKLITKQVCVSKQEHKAALIKGLKNEWPNSPDRAGILPTAGRQIKAMAGTTIAKVRLAFCSQPPNPQRGNLTTLFK